MNIQRFTAATSREALSKARMAFGDDTLIISNRPTASGVEVLAAAEASLAEFDQPDEPVHSAPIAVKKKQALAPQAASRPSTQALVEEDADRLSMSTLSFQDYVRERMLKRRHEADQNQASASTKTTGARPANGHFSVPMDSPPQQQARSIAPVASSPDATQRRVTADIADELHALKTLIEDRFNTLTWLGKSSQNPTQSSLMLQLIRSGFSPHLVRAVLEKMPEGTDATASMQWITDVLERNLKTDAQALPLQEEGGIYALVGATGVGKTSTTAKLAGLCARMHGSASVGLITLDNYRIGAHEQLRSYGRMLGVVAHLAHDRSALQDLLGLLSSKKMILIDTTGISPRDPKKREMLDLLTLPGVQRLLVLNAVSHGDSIDEVISVFRTTGGQQAVLSKVDEAVKLAPALDAVIRHQLQLRGVTTGQKMPDDWERADAAKLVKLALRSSVKSAFDPQISDLGFFFSQASGRHQGGLHA